MTDFPEKRFFSTIQEFVESLREVFPEDESLQTFKIRRNSKSIRDIVSTLNPYADEIRDMKTELFYENKLDDFLGLNIKSYMIRNDVSETTKSSIWQYLQMILLLGKFIVKPKEVMQTDTVTNFMNSIEENLRKAEKTRSQNADASKSSAESSSESIMSMFQNLAKEIAEDIQLPENLNPETFDMSNPMSAISSLIGNPDSLVKIASKVGDKLSQKIEKGDLTEDKMNTEIEQMKSRLSDISKSHPGMPDFSKMIDNLLNVVNSDKPPDLQSMFGMVSNMMSSFSPETGRTSNGNMMNLLSGFMSRENDLPDLDEVAARIKKDQKKKFKEQNEKFKAGRELNQKGQLRLENKPTADSQQNETSKQNMKSKRKDVKPAIVK